MADSDGESSVSSGFLAGMARDLAPSKEPEPVEEDDSSSDACANPLFRPLTPGLPPDAGTCASNSSLYAGKAAAGCEANEANGSTRASQEVINRPSVADAGAHDDDDLGKRFAELEAAEELRKSTHSQNDNSEGPLKRRRRSVAVAESPASLPTPPLENDVSTVSCAAPSRPCSPPPEKIMQAFAKLGLAITYSVNAIERASRRLASRFHPDKVIPERRWMATQEFRAVQEAKQVLLDWVREGKVTEDAESDHSQGAGCRSEADEDSPGDDGAGDSGSISDEGPDELMACGIRPRSRSRSPSEAKSSDTESGGEGAEIALRQQPVVSDNQYALGVSGSSAIETMRKQSLALQARAPRRDVCTECFEAPPLKGGTACAKCLKELKQLMRNLQTGKLN